MKCAISIVALLSFLFPMASLPADVVLDDGDRVSSISSLRVSGAVYDATMHYSTGWLAYKKRSGKNSITFNTVGSAVSAAKAIGNAVKAKGSIGSLSGTGGLCIPYIDEGSYVVVVCLRHGALATYSDFPAQGILDEMLIRDPLFADHAWVSFAPR